MLKYYSELTHHSSPKSDKTITFGGEVVETDPIIIQTQPDDESFKLMPGLLTEEERKAYILDIVNNHVTDYNNIITVKNEQDGTDHMILTEEDVSNIKGTLYGEYNYTNYDNYEEYGQGCYFSGSNGWGVEYDRETGIINVEEERA